MPCCTGDRGASPAGRFWIPPPGRAARPCSRRTSSARFSGDSRTARSTSVMSDTPEAAQPAQTPRTQVHPHPVDVLDALVLGPLDSVGTPARRKRAADGPDRVLLL